MRDANYFCLSSPRAKDLQAVKLILFTCNMVLVTENFMHFINGGIWIDERRCSHYLSSVSSQEAVNRA
jgi:hypothetical protein